MFLIGLSKYILNDRENQINKSPIRQAQQYLHRCSCSIGSNRGMGWHSKLMLVVAECSGVCAATSLPSAGATQAEWRGLRQATGRPSAPTAWPGIANLFG